MERSGIETVVFLSSLLTKFSCVLNIVCLPSESEDPSIRGFESGHFYLRVRNRRPGSKLVAHLADQFPGRWLLALGRSIMAVKIDMLEKVPPHVTIAAGLGGKSQCFS